MKLRICFLFLLTLFATQTSASIIKKPPTKPIETTYKDLCCTPEDKAFIYEIISIVAENGKLSLFFKQTHLKEMGSRINHVHPFKFITTIFTDPYLKSCMYYVWDDYFKRSEFMEGLGPSLTREADKGKLLPYLNEFAAELGVPAENLRPYFEVRDWENLVLYLIQS